MDPDSQVLSFLDLLDLDEEVIDLRLKSIIARNSYSNKHLANALHLLQYKNLINLREDTDCENNDECRFVAKLIIGAHNDNIDIVCKIINVVLQLNKLTVVSNSEHLLQQIWPDIVMHSKPPRDTSEVETEEQNATNILLSLKLCDSILDAVIRSNERLSLPIFEVPLEHILSCSDDKIISYFLNNTVPRLFESIIGYNILDRIWSHVKQLENGNRDIALKILSCLSEFFLPVPDRGGEIKFESVIIFHNEFWSILLDGLKSNDPTARKTSVYLIKRAIDSITAYKKDVIISSEVDAIFHWPQKETKLLKENWNNFFILMDSLEEKQSNIVLPSLQLFETIKGIENCWLNCAFTIGLKHDNIQVRLKCIEHKLKTKLQNLPDTVVLLQAINDINLYDNLRDCDNLKNRISEAIINVDALVLILKAAPKVKWSPVPFYHLIDILTKVTKDLSSIIAAKEFFAIIVDVIKVPCNNIPIRNAVKINLSSFIGQCYTSLHWDSLLSIYSMVKWDKFSDESKKNNPFIKNIKELSLLPDEKEEFIKVISSTHNNIDFGLLYLETHKEDFDTFMNIVKSKIERVKEMTNRQYCNKLECFNDVVYITYLYQKTFNNTYYKENITSIISKVYNMLSHYMFALLQSDDFTLDFEEMALIINSFQSMKELDDLETTNFLLDIFKTISYLLTDKNFKLEKKLFAIMFIAIIIDKTIANNMERNYSLGQILQLFKDTSFEDASNVDDIGRYKNAFNEKSCEIVYKYIEFYNVIESKTLNKKDLLVLEGYIENIIECGGYGCLKWILKIVNKVLPQLLSNEGTQLNIIEFIEKSWKETEELKSNNQYSPCVEEFIKLITQDELLMKPLYNNVIIRYCSKIIEYGPLKNTPLYFLVRELNKKMITQDFGHIVYILSEIMLFSPVPKKDQRIADNVAMQILQDSKYGMDSEVFDTHFNFKIQYNTIFILSKIRHSEILETIVALLIKKIEDHFKTKQRYHGNSQSHRLMLIGLQHLLFLHTLTLKPLHSKKVFTWMIELLGKFPHQPSVKICLEWYIALVFSLENTQLDEKVLELLKSKNVPLTSQFMILYWTLKHKLFVGIQKESEVSYVMEFLLQHTMGQIFNIRLHAQYLAVEIYKMAKNNVQKYAYTIEVIEKTFVESCKDKNFLRLQEDYFIKEFDVVRHLTPSFIYYFVPRYFGIGANEIVDKEFIRNILKDIYSNTISGNDNINYWHLLEEEVFTYDFNKSLEISKEIDNSDATGTIQKKYIPWRTIMSDIDVYETGKKKETISELIVVASLIDKLPNLGGMARTSEVFGVKTYVVDSMRHLQDRQFQGLSVSAERWVNVEEVRPGHALKNYLMMKKNEGYTVVAAEQTSTSVPLQKFIFPNKTLLLLGHEKEGIPCDLLPLMDRCVEIPQHGFVRSLNVHVTAAIFIWEYTRQNIL